MNLIPAYIRHPEYQLAPDYGFPSGRRRVKTLRQIKQEANYYRFLRRFALMSPVIALGLIAEGIAYVAHELDEILTTFVIRTFKGIDSI